MSIKKLNMKKKHNEAKMIQMSINNVNTVNKIKWNKRFTEWCENKAKIIEICICEEYFFGKSEKENKTVHCWNILYRYRVICIPINMRAYGVEIANFKNWWCVQQFFDVIFSLLFHFILNSCYFIISLLLVQWIFKRKKKSRIQKKSQAYNLGARLLDNDLCTLQFAEKF